MPITAKVLYMSAARPPQEASCSPSVPQTSSAQSLCPGPQAALLPPTCSSSKLQQSKCQASCEVFAEVLQNLCSNVPLNGRRFEDFRK